MEPPSRDRHTNPSGGFTRRSLLGTGALAVGAVATSPLAGCSSPPDPARGKGGEPPIFVLIHGSASNSYFWTPLVRELAALGRTSLPIDLPGHGIGATVPRAQQAPQDPAGLARFPSVVGDLRLHDYVEHAHRTVVDASRHGPVVLVGHSLGGSVVTGVANAAPELLGGICYISAFCCTELGSPVDYLTTEEARTSAAAATTPSLTPAQQALVPAGTSRYNWRSADPAFVASAHRQLMGDASEEEFLATIAVAQQSDESIRASLDPARIDAERWGAVPRHYVRLGKDRLNTPALQNRMIAEADRAAPDHPFTVDDIDTSHLGVFLRSHDLARLLVERWP